MPIFNGMSMQTPHAAPHSAPARIPMRLNRIHCAEQPALASRVTCLAPKVLVVLLLFVPLVPWALGVGGDQGRPGEVARAVPSPNAGPQHRASPCLWLTTAVAAPRARGCWGSSLRLGRGMLGRSAGGVAFEPYMVSSCLERVTSIIRTASISMSKVIETVESDYDGHEQPYSVLINISNPERPWRISHPPLPLHPGKKTAPTTPSRPSGLSSRSSRAKPAWRKGPNVLQ